MRNIALLLFLTALLSSCSSLPSSSSNRIVIEFRDSVTKDFYLLALRDSSIVVAPYTTDYSSIDSLNALASVIPFRKIEHLYKNSSPSLGDELWAATTGLLVGSFFAILPYFEGGSGDGHPNQHTGGFPIIGLGGGIVLGLLFNNAYDERFFDSKEHLDMIKFRAYYKNEPPELQKIK